MDFSELNIVAEQLAQLSRRLKVLYDVHHPRSKALEGHDQSRIEAAFADPVVFASGRINKHATARKYDLTAHIIHGHMLVRGLK